MAKVDPFIIPIPRKLLSDPELAGYFIYLNRWAHDIWVRTGAGSDDVQNINAVKRYRPNLSHVDDRSIIVTSSNYTTAGDQTIIATGSITITLNTSPDDMEEVEVQRATSSGPVTVSGTINSDSSYKLCGNYESKVFRYVTDRGEWIII